MMYALIVAGGAGTRLWPLSRKNSPKQLLKLIDKNTLLQTTFQRLLKGFSKNRIFVATTAAHAPQIAKQLSGIPKNHYSIEPVQKDRGPAIALSALLIQHFDAKASFVTAWSDHYIKNETAYFEAIKTAEKFLLTHPDYFLTVGAKPSYAHTGFGYIEQGKMVSNGAYAVRSFKEKPDLKTAQKFIKSGKFLWNTGYFICRADTLLKLYKQHQPQIYKILMKIKPFLGTKKQQAAINKFYPQMPHADIEKGIIEKLSRVVVVPAKFEWADIGSWKIIKDVLSQEHKNLTKGNVALHNTNKSLIYNYEDKLVAVVGVEDLIIVNTKDALLIALKDKSEEIKELVKKLQADEKLKKYL
jgi:mannose-1-phosphate guanylyltransferase